MATCPNCNGRGKICGPKDVLPIGQTWKECPTCNGTCSVANYMYRWIECPECNGWGEVGRLIAPFVCPLCVGRGMVTPSRAR